jgi:type I site-specific restriction endonuclease
VDEAHRSIYQKYRAIFSYFDALLVGLTATPKDEIDRNTYSLFDLENGVPTDAYGLADAIDERYLVPPKAVSVPLRFQRQGIRYDDLSEDEKDQWDALEWDEDGEEPPDEVSAEAVNRWLFNIDTVDKVLELLMTRGQKVAGGDRIGKTIIFAKNNDHAEFIAKRFDDNYPHYAGTFARVITFKVDYAQTLVREQMLLIEAVAGDEWWQDVTLPMLEQARRKLRALIKLLEKKKRKIVYSDFADELGETSEIVLPLGGSAGDFERFRLTRAFLRAHENHLTLYKLRRNQPLTAADLAELERMLVESGAGSADDVNRASDEAHGLGLFVRSLVGLDREAATQALSGFVAGKTLSANQLEFVNLIVSHLTERGVMEAALLYEPPFTDIAPQGPDALFTSAQIDELFVVLGQVKAMALAA